MPPDRRAITKHAEQHKNAAGDSDQPFWNDTCQQRISTDPARHGDKTGAHPGSIGPLGGKDSAVGSELSTSVGAALDARRAALHLGRAVLYTNGAVLELLAALDDLRL